MKLYVAGPMTGLQNHNFPAFDSAAAELRAAGHEVINPADRGIVPGWSWEDYMRVDIRDLLDCDAVALLPEWRSSRGACLEVYVAHAVGMVTRNFEDWIET